MESRASNGQQGQLLALLGRVEWSSIGSHGITQLAQSPPGPSRDVDGWLLGTLGDVGSTGVQDVSFSSSPDGSLLTLVKGDLLNRSELSTRLCSCEVRRGGFSDAEAIQLAYSEWGHTLLDHLEGSYALVVLDLRQKKVTLARDRLGVGSLFYRSSSDVVAVSSSALDLTSFDGRRSDLSASALIELLYRQSISPPRTIYEDVCATEPGVVYELLLGRDGSPRAVTSHRWSFGASQPRRIPELLEKLDESLSASLGNYAQDGGNAWVALSGGIDSSLVALAASEAGAASDAAFLDVGYGASSQVELENSRAAATLGGLSWHLLRAGDETRSLHSHWIASADTPPVDGFNIFLLCHSLRRRCKAAYTGLGGDELFCGYPDLSTALSSCTNEDHLVTEFLHATALLPEALVARVAAELCVDWQQEKQRAMSRARRALRSSGARSLDDKLRVLLVTQYLLPCLVRDATRYASVNGVDIRAPLLSSGVAEVALEWPAQTMTDRPSMMGKLPLRELAARKGLPRELTCMPKRGFVLPYAALLSQVRSPTDSSLLLAALGEDHPASPYRAWALTAVRKWVDARFPEHRAATALGGIRPGWLT